MLLLFIICRATWQAALADSTVSLAETGQQKGKAEGGTPGIWLAWQGWPFPGTPLAPSAFPNPAAHL